MYSLVKKTAINKTSFKNLIIIDWDDTLFPTSWAMKNDISVDKNNIFIFQKIDNMILTLLKSISIYGKIIIITNASLTWIKQCLTTVPFSSAFISKNVEIFSAKDNYGNIYPNDVFMWKNKEFESQIKKFMYKNPIKKNVISIGDSEYEYNAMVSLFSFLQIYNINVKTVRLKQISNIDFLIDQLLNLERNIKYICTVDKHIDLIFIPNDKLDIQ